MRALAARQPAAIAAFEDVEVPIASGWRLESGDRLSDGCVRLRRFGAREGPQIVALGGISSGRQVCGDGGWWSPIMDGAVELDRFGVIGFDFAPLDDEHVRITPYDQARLMLHALGGAGVERLHAFVGASYGAMVGLAFAALAPERVARLCVISAAARASAQASGWRGVQRRTVAFALEHGDGAAGLSLARQLAMMTYRSAEEFESRFEPGMAADGLCALDRYLIARGEAYVDAMPPRRWLSLSEAIDRFSIEPEAVKTPTLVAACPTDQLVPYAAMRDLAGRLPKLLGFYDLPSVYGHDAFLKERGLLTPLLRDFFEGGF